ncbi:MULTISPECIES: N-acetylglucosaminidase [unclassified Gemella]|uniref:N-acetylglucosaminidase n=1 Tax=unclassified Gemella TaxID=2624949 RepID=UPI0015D053D3|nr:MULTISPECIES: glucosaminidase domain-containing protein [unclassified Gemella]MBF0709900.1 glucosaminidase domain-containing protein [Gemella sp. GL1.1]NYS27244.1 glucosaminidase domain-containing protein [Gemella sp. GL1]
MKVLKYILVLIFIFLLREDYSVGLASNKYYLEAESLVYESAEDALRNENPKIIYPTGEYYIYKESQGMLNISKNSGLIGGWINPNTNIMYDSHNQDDTKLMEDLEIYSVQNKVKTYETSNKAEDKEKSDTDYNSGIYYVYKEEKAMLNISPEQGKEDLWINPTDEENTLFTGYDNNKFYVENTLANGWYNDGNDEYFFYLGEKYTGYAMDSTGFKYFNNGKYSDKKSSKKNISRTKDRNLAINFFQYMKLDTTTIYNEGELNRAIEKFAGPNSKFYAKGQIFKEAEEKYRVNALYLLAHAAIETSWGHSEIAQDKNNFYGIGAYDDTPYKSASSFESIEDGILKGAEWISSRYIHSSLYPADGAFLGNKTEGMNKNYATDVRWGRNIARLMKEINNYLGNKEK